MAKKPDSGNLKLEALNEVLNIMQKGELAELLYEEKDLKIQMKKAGSMMSTMAPQYVSVQQAPAQQPQPAAASQEPEKLQEDSKTGIIKSPMVGTFYRSPSPDSPEFVNVGDMIEPGKTVCIIEAMKIMNEIKSEVKGRVKEILIDNAQAVEFNQPLIIVEKS
ncbi:MAG: acetyl-CoA carboxylase biotin carboxyl carrier protein [Spirochaetia bacterium]|nr:acetyl-CoA carboxylase biotin carboxyl carrier protein [Spirochaetia bacterium]